MTADNKFMTDIEDYIKCHCVCDDVNILCDPITLTIEIGIGKGFYSAKTRILKREYDDPDTLKMILDRFIQEFDRGPKTTYVPDDRVLWPKINPWLNNATKNVAKKNLEIKNVCFNDPLTVVIWSDGTKTFVKAHNEEYDPEKGLAMAIAKKFLGNKYDYHEQFEKWLGKCQSN